MRVEVEEKENGYIVNGYFDGSPMREVVVEGTDPKKVGAAVLAMFKAPRKSRAKKEVAV